MSEWWWYAIVAIAIVVAVYVGLRIRRSPTTLVDADATTHDYRADRETGRLAGMSDEDRAWESASLERNRVTEEGRDRNPPSVS
jgi:hypothetical protein